MVQQCALKEYSMNKITASDMTMLLYHCDGMLMMMVIKVHTYYSNNMKCTLTLCIACTLVIICICWLCVTLIAENNPLYWKAFTDCNSIHLHNPTTYMYIHCVHVYILRHTSAGSSAFCLISSEISTVLAPSSDMTIVNPMGSTSPMPIIFDSFSEGNKQRWLGVSPTGCGDRKKLKTKTAIKKTPCTKEMCENPCTKPPVQGTVRQPLNYGQLDQRY